MHEQLTAILERCGAHFDRTAQESIHDVFSCLKGGLKSDSSFFQRTYLDGVRSYFAACRLLRPLLADLMLNDK